MYFHSTFAFFKFKTANGFAMKKIQRVVVGVVVQLLPLFSSPVWRARVRKPAYTTRVPACATQARGQSGLAGFARRYIRPRSKIQHILIDVCDKIVISVKKKTRAYDFPFGDSTRMDIVVTFR